MNAAAPRISQDLVARKVEQLRNSGLPRAALAAGCSEALRENLPLRDSIVLRKAKRYAEAATPDVRSAWAKAVIRLWWAVPDSTFDLWIAPLCLLSGDGHVLQLAAPGYVRCWVERRYVPLIREALQATGPYTDVELVETAA